MNKSTLKLARELLDRFFRDAEGRTNRQLDVYFTLEDMSVSRDKAEPALEYLASRGLLNTFGPDIAFLTDEGCRVAADDVDLGAIPKVLRDFEQAPRTENLPSGEPAPELEPEAGPRERPDRPALTHIAEDGSEDAIDLGWVCTIGRAADNDVTVHDKRASKHHAELRFESGGYVLHDLDSANGTLLNGEYVVEPMAVKHDDEVVIGRTLLLLQLPEVVPVPEGPPPSEVATADAVPPPEPELPPAPELPPMPGVEEPLPPSSPPQPSLPEPPTLAPSAPSPAGQAEPAVSPRELFQVEPLEEMPGSEPDVFAPPEPTEPPPPPVQPLEEVEPLELLEPDALVPLDSSPPEEPVPLETPIDLPDTLPAPSSPDESEEAATIMTTRAEIFGETPLPAAEPEAPPAIEPVPEAPPPEPELPPTAPSPPAADVGAGRAEQITDPGVGAEVEPALIALLSHVQDRLQRGPAVPERDRLLEAVDLLRRSRDVVRIAREIEDELSGV